MKLLIFTYNISEIKLGGIGCSTTLPDSCVGQNTVCPSGTCVCETGYYDSDGDGESGTCLASKYHRRLVQISTKYLPLTITKTIGEHLWHILNCYDCSSLPPPPLPEEKVSFFRFSLGTCVV